MKSRNFLFHNQNLPRVPGVVGWPDVAAAAFAAIAAATVVAAAAVVFVDIAAVGSVAGTATAVAEVVDGPGLELEELELLELFESVQHNDSQSIQ